MKKTITASVEIEVDDVNPDYCDLVCHWFDNGHCMLFLDWPDLEDKKFDPFKRYADMKFKRCKKCWERGIEGVPVKKENE